MPKEHRISFVRREWARVIRWDSMGQSQFRAEANVWKPSEKLLAGVWRRFFLG